MSLFSMLKVLGTIHNIQYVASIRWRIRRGKPLSTLRSPSVLPGWGLKRSALVPQQEISQGDSHGLRDLPSSLCWNEVMAKHEKAGLCPLETMEWLFRAGYASNHDTLLLKRAPNSPAFSFQSLSTVLKLSQHFELDTVIKCAVQTRHMFLVIGVAEAEVQQVLKPTRVRQNNGRVSRESWEARPAGKFQVPSSFGKYFWKASRSPVVKGGKTTVWLVLCATNLSGFRSF